MASVSMRMGCPRSSTSRARGYMRAVSVAPVEAEETAAPAVEAAHSWTKRRRFIGRRKRLPCGQDSKSANTAAIALALLMLPGAALAAGVIETPTNSEIASGIGTISGWNCTARVITIKIDGYAALTAGSGTERNDTAGICG